MAHYNLIVKVDSVRTDKQSSDEADKSIVHVVLCAQVYIIRSLSTKLSYHKDNARDANDITI